MAYCLISFGSNLGDRRALITRSVQLLRAEGLLHDFQCSRLYETPPIGGPSGQSVFLNTTAVVQTHLRAREVLALLQSIETKLGRVRDQRWDARSIDLDLVLYGDWIGADLKLTLPHPRLVARRFVLQPAIDVAGEWREPRSGWTLRELNTHLMAAPPSMALTGGTQALRSAICDQLETNSQLTILRKSPSANDAEVNRGFATLYQPAPKEERGLDPVPKNGEHWVSDFVPSMPPADPLLAPRVIARLNPISHEAWWPEPRRQWRNGWQWPEYQLDALDAPHAAKEVLAALEAMECAVTPITDDGFWGE